jgi:hypothetical protein
VAKKLGGELFGKNWTPIIWECWFDVSGTTAFQKWVCVVLLEVFFCYPETALFEGGPI